ncbi:sensor histidine kinase [Muricoccus vinaceus]|uniref:histidine kinase n=1 Tax=Muricoccus vinaceus TaxID=424704 RepID=A0ABV6IT50_9PROT
MPSADATNAAIQAGEQATSLPVAAPRVFTPSLKVVLSTAFGALALLTAVISSAAIGHVADKRIRADIGAEFTSAAEHVAALLDRGLFERLRDVQVAASLDTMIDTNVTIDGRRRILERLQETYPDYAILGYIGADGRVVETSSGILRGADVSGREYFQRGKQGPFVSDVHDAILMAPLLGRGPDNPPRFVDLAAPVRAADNALVGVVGAHLYWEWAEGIERHVMAPILARHPGAEAFILSRQGQVLLGPRSQRGATITDLAPSALADLAARRAGSVVERSRPENGAEDHTHLVGYAATQGHRTFHGLGWTVLVRQDAEAAFAPARQLAQQVLFWGFVAAALAAGLGWYLAGLITRPLADLCRAAERLQTDPRATEVPIGQGLREVTLLSSSISALVAGVRWRETALQNSEARLRLATEAAGITAWEIDLTPEQRARSRRSAVAGLSDPLAEWTIESFLASVVPEDHDGVLEAYNHAVDNSVDLCFSCRVRGDDNNDDRWVEVRGVPLAVPPGGRVTRYTGVIEDITERKRSEQALQLLVRELDHRVKNQFAVFDGLVRFTAKTAADPATMASVLHGRIAALSAAHELVRDATGDGSARGLHSTTMIALLQTLLAPYGIRLSGDHESSSGRVEMDGPRVTIGPTSASALALVVHELATNAARHGALSLPTGVASLTWSAITPKSMVVVRWQERGGPELFGEPVRRGFGTSLVRQSVQGQLGGHVAFDWSQPEGLVVSLRLPADRLAR